VRARARVQSFHPFMTELSFMRMMPDAMKAKNRFSFHNRMDLTVKHKDINRMRALRDRILKSSPEHIQKYVKNK
jgi:hypothetical protein